MAGTVRAPALIPALATGIGSLPHKDASVAAQVVLKEHGRLPSAPQLPLRNAREALIPQWARALPEVSVQIDGCLAIDLHADAGPPDPGFADDAHGGLLAFLDLAASSPTPLSRVKVQIAGPLTLGVALREAGLPTERAFRRAAEATRAWAVAIESLVTTRLPDASLLMFFDEPALVLWQEQRAPIEREAAIDILSGALATPTCMTGVHVCGDGDRRLALEAGPQVLGVEVSDELLADADALARHLDADGWIAWGAVPTDRPVGESVEPLWRALVGVWCELTRRSCDPVRLRNQGVITPACGLAGHGPTQAERALRLARMLSERVQDHVAAARLTLGA
jgi:hypothetical protein